MSIQNLGSQSDGNYFGNCGGGIANLQFSCPLKQITELKSRQTATSSLVSNTERL